MIILKAPYPSFTKAIVLPNPKLGDSYTVIRETNIKRGIDGTPYTYNKTTANVRLLFQIEMTRQKSLELEGFIKTFGGQRWKLIDHTDTNYLAILVSDFEKRNFKRAWYNPEDQYGSAESVTIDLEFEAEPL